VLAQVLPQDWQPRRALRGLMTRPLESETEWMALAAPALCEA
jgi:hypothetical protein